MQKIKTRYFLIAAFILTITALGMFAYGETTPTIPETTWSDNGNYDVSWYHSSGDIRHSTEREYNITTAEQLAGLAVLCNQGVLFNSYVDNPSVLTNIVINIQNDIDLGEHKWKPIGMHGQAKIDSTEVPRYFMGRFNGHGHKISNVIVRETTEEVGFFGKSGGANSLIANVILENIDVRSTYKGDENSNSMTGGLVGNAGIGNNGNGTGIDNCIVSGYVDGQNAGGIAGYDNDAIRHCVNNAKVVGAKTAGGIVPLFNNGTVAHCVNTGEISLPNKGTNTCYAGGIVGVSMGTPNPVIYCANVGKSDGGALIGHLQVSGGLSQCYWVTGTADKSIQSNDTTYTDEALSIDSYASVTDMPVVAALLDEVPYGFRGSDYSPYFSGGTFTVTPTLYPLGSKYAATANITAKCTFDSYVENFISKGNIPANGTPTKIYVEKIDSHGQVYLIMKSGVEGNPVELLRSNGDNEKPTISVYTASVIVQSISLDKMALSLDVAGTSSDTLTASLYPKDPTSKDITWNTDNEKIVTVKPTGSNNSQCNIQAVGGGTATITATSANGLIASCTVTVKGKPTSVTGVTLSSAALALKSGETSSLTATVAPEGVDQTVTWNSDKPAVAKVENGTVTAVAAGTAVIKATSSTDATKSASCTVTVTELKEPQPEKPVINDTVKTPDTVDTAQKPTVFTDTTTAAKAISTDIAATDLEISTEGSVYVTGAKTEEIIKASLTDETLQKTERLPIFTISADRDVVACSWKMKGAALLADTIEAVDVRKIISATQTAKLEYAADAANFADGKFTVLTADGKQASGTIDAAADYQLMLFIKDSGLYDLDSAKGTVTDPAVIVKTEAAAAPTPASGSGSSGGCSAGLGALALLALTPLALRRKVKK